MKKVIIGIIIISILISGLVYAMAEKKERDIEENLLKAETQINKYSIEDIENMLRGQGKYQDEIDVIVNKFIEIISIYEVEEKAMESILSLAQNGRELEQLLNIYEFITITTGEYKHILKYYNIGNSSEFKNPYWMEEAYNIIYKKESLTIEEINEYYEQGITEEDIITANYFNMCGEQNIKEIINSKIAEKSWKEIVEQSNPEISYLAFTLSTNDKEEITEFTKNAKKLKTDKNTKEKTSKRNVKSQEKISKRNNLTMNGIIELGKSKISNITNAELEEYLMEGYYIREIEKATKKANGDKEKTVEYLRYGIKEEK